MAATRAAGGGASALSTRVIGGNDSSDLVGLARVVRLEEGLHALIVGSSPVHAESVAGLALPVTAVSPGPSTDYASVEIALSSSEYPGWLSAEGGTVIAKVAEGGGIVVLTSYGINDEAALPELEVLHFGPRRAAPTAVPESAAAPTLRPRREIDVEIILHIEREGDRQMPAHGWAGNPGQRKRIEAFGIRPLEVITPGNIEYMAFGLGGRQTPWVTDGKLCGTRGRGLPLTGFAIRLVPALRDRFDVIYEGSFFSSGAIGPCRNGEPCMADESDDPLEAISLRVIERSNEG